MDVRIGDAVTVAGLTTGPTPVGRVSQLDGPLSNVEWQPGSWLGADGLPYPFRVVIAAPVSWLVPEGA